MTVNDPGKFRLLAMALGGGFAIILVAIVMRDPASAVIGVGIVGPVIGYMTGNGVLARKGLAPEPTIRSSKQTLPGDDVVAKLRLVLDELETDVVDEDLDEDLEPA